MLPTQEDFEDELTARIRQAVQATMQGVFDEELERLVGAGPYQRSDQRVDVRNGSYDRRVVTTTGEVAVRVGRTRAGGAATAPLGRYARRQAEVNDAIAESYVRGVSTRDMGSVTEALLGKRVGRSTVSRVTRRLDDEVEGLLTPLTRARSSSSTPPASRATRFRASPSRCPPASQQRARAHVLRILGCDPVRQPGSLLESRGGSVLESAEAGRGRRRRRPTSSPPSRAA